MPEQAYDARAVVEAIKSVLPVQEAPIGHHEAHVGLSELRAMKDCLAAGLVSYSHVDKFQALLEKTCSVRHALAVNSGTAALHLALLAVGVKPGDDVIVPSLTFVATANAVTYVGAVPVFVDAEARTLGMDPLRLSKFIGEQRKRQRPIAAIIAVHALGMPCLMKEIEAIATLNGIPLIEDAAEALGSHIDGRPCGSFGDVSALSFNNNKMITTGGGGAVMTSSASMAAYLFKMATTARVMHPYEMAHDEVAFNYRMPNICAAVGFAQLSQLDDFLRAKTRLASEYEAALRGVPGVTFLRSTHGFSNCWLNALLVAKDWHIGKRAILTAMIDAGIMGRAIFQPLHTLPMYALHVADRPATAEDLHRRLVCLPSGVALGERLLQ